MLLERKRVGPAAIDAALAELEAAGLLDDARYARLFADDKRTLERWGSERIARELRRRGVSPTLVEEVVRRERAAELDAALDLLGCRLPARNERERARAWRLLVRRGYEPELAAEAVRAHGREAA
jgi:regulatory protein